MAITLHDFTIERIPGVAKTATVFGHTTDPGVIEVEYPTGITGPATITVAGTRVWRSITNGRDGGFNAPAALAAILKNRNNKTLFFDIPYDNFPHRTPQNTQSLSNLTFIGYAAYRRLPWRLSFLVTASSATPYIVASLNSASNAGSVLSGTAFSIATAGSYRCAITSVAGTPNIVKFFSSTAAVVTENPGTWADDFGDCNFIFGGGFSFAAYGSIISDGDISTWLAGGGFPSGSIVTYMQNEEADAIPYDTSGNNYDGVYDADATYAASKLHRDYTDSGFVTPAFSIPITVASDAAAGPYTIGLRRNRVNIPARASDAEKYDDGSVVVTVSDIATVVKCGPSQDLRSRI